MNAWTDKMLHTVIRVNRGAASLTNTKLCAGSSFLQQPPEKSVFDFPTLESPSVPELVQMLTS